MPANFGHNADPKSRHGHPRRRHLPGFTLVEILIVVVVLGILASIVIPQFSNASQQARENTLKEELQYLRTQIAVYKAQHQDIAPGYTGADPTSTPSATAFVAQMSQYTDMFGNVSSTPSRSFPFGQYLSQMPVNPVNGYSTIEMVGNGQTMPAPDGTTGWLYIAQTQTIIANVGGNDISGTPYASY